MAIIVELIAQDEHTLALRSFDADAISIGRSLDNDFVVTDPYVDPHHLRVAVGDAPATFFVEDIGTLNGSRLGRRRLTETPQLAHSGCVLHIGKTSLRVSDSASSVEPALKLTTVDSFFDWAASSLTCLSALVAVLLYVSFNAWVNGDASMQSAQYFEKLGNSLATLLLTAGFWAIVGRIVKRRVNFVAHFTIAALTQLVVLAWTTLMYIVTLNLSLVSLLPVLGFLGRGLVFVASVEFHLRLATNISAQRRMAFELLVLVVMIIYPAYKAVDAASQFRVVAPYNSSLLPRSLQFYSVTTTGDFLDKAGLTMEEALDQARKKRADVAALKSARPLDVPVEPAPSLPVPE